MGTTTGGRELACNLPRHLSKIIEGEEWEKLQYKYVEIGKAVNLRQASTGKA